jgi:hypothetical protein
VIEYVALHGVIQAPRHEREDTFLDRELLPSFGLPDEIKR